MVNLAAIWFKQMVMENQQTSKISVVRQIYLVIPVSVVPGVGKVALERIILRHTLDGQTQ